MAGRRKARGGWGGRGDTDILSTLDATAPRGGKGDSEE